MAIQFSCVGCEQPIEVDDAFAGKNALCPYCRREVTVPSASTYVPTEILARPAGQGVSAGGLSSIRAGGYGGAEVGQPTRNRFATWAVICAVTFVATILLTMAQVLPIAMKHLPTNPQNMTAEEQESITRTVNAELSTHTGLVLSSLLGMVAAVAGFVLALAGLSKGGAPVRCWISLIVCGLPALCIVMGLITNLSGGAKP